MGIFPDQIGRAPVRAAALAAASAVTVILGLCALRILPWPGCPFFKYLHLACPMCGTTRAVLFFLRGEYGPAFAANPLWWLWLFWSAVSFADLWHRVVRSRDTFGQNLLARAMQNRWLKSGHLAAALLAFLYGNMAK